MNEIKIAAPEFSRAYISDLRQILPSIAKELNVTIDDLYVIYMYSYPMEYMHNPALRDIPYKLQGLIEGVPFIKRCGMHHPDRSYIGSGFGVHYYTCRQNPSIRYAMYATYDQDYIIVPKGQVYRLIRIARDACRKDQAQKLPILPEKTLESVLRNTVGFLKHAKQLMRYGVKAKKGILFDGPPGNGKTMLCRYLQGIFKERGFECQDLTASAIERAFQNDELEDIFQSGPVMFFDDVDVSYLNRKAGSGKMACALLTAMDGMKDGGPLLRIFTTNESIDDLDDAFTRPGRIDHIITIEKPDEHLRRRLVVEIWPQEIQNAIDIDQLIEQSDDFSFAELEAIRTNLATWKVENGNWDLNRAILEFHERKKSDRKRVGFSKKR
jgi:hypothetical protein